MTVFQFIILVFKQRPAILFLTSGVFLLAALLELMSLAAILPVMAGLFDFDGEGNAADTLFSTIGLTNITLETGLIIILCFMVCRGLLLVAGEYIVGRVAKSLETQTRRDIFDGLMHAKWDYLASFQSGQTPNTLLRESEFYAHAIQKTGEFLSAFILSLVLIASSVFVSWQTFLIFVVAVIPYLAFTRLIGNLIRKHAQNRIKTANAMSLQTSENMNQVKYIKAAGLEKILLEKFMVSARQYASHSLWVIFHKIIVKYFPEVFGVLILGTIIFFTHRYMDQSPMDLMFFMLLLFRGYRQVATMQSVRSILIDTIPSYEICDSLIKESHKHREETSGHPLETFPDDGIQIDNASYAYPNQDPPAITDLSASIPATGMIAFVGKSGAGKTTIGDILIGLIKPSSGDIIINQMQTLAETDMASWRKNIGYVPQENVLIYGTIAENIVLGADDQSQDNVLKAAKAAHIHDFILTLPDQYDTMVGDGGTQFSGGQKQRVALARALARNPKLLILDEATSALDNETEKLIQKSIAEISKEMAIVVIAHRLSTVQNADKIYLMDQGKVLEEGDYKSLMKEKGAFWSLYQTALDE